MPKGLECRETRENPGLPDYLYRISLPRSLKTLDVLGILESHDHIKNYPDMHKRFLRFS